MTTFLFGKPVTPVERIFMEAKNVEAVEKGFDRDATRAEKRLAKFQSAADNLWTNQQKRYKQDPQASFMAVERQMENLLMLAGTLAHKPGLWEVTLV